MTLTRIRHVAALNPPVPEFSRARPDDLLTFIPLEAVWADGLDTSRERPKHEVDSGYTRFREGDILIPKITPTFQADRSTIARGLRNGFGCGTTELHVVRPSTLLDARFASYLVSSSQFLQQGTAEMVGVAGQKRVPEQFILDFPVRVTGVNEQRSVADFLDAVTGRVDSIVKRRRAMTLAVSERAELAVASLVLTGRAGDRVTAGGEYYLPEPPAGWRRTRLRHLRCLVQTGPFGSQLHAEEYVADGWPVVNPLNLRDGRINPDRLMTVTDEKRSELRRHVLRPGDIVFGRRGEMGRAGLVTDRESGWLCGTGSLLVRIEDDRLAPGYLKLLLETPPLRAYFGIESVGSTMDNLNSDIVLGTPIFIPPMDVQHSIVERVQRVRNKMHSTLSLFGRQIDAMKEHRQALITAAVTGQIDVTRKVV